ncbi:hypothetical protein GCM10009760_03230 [Kitasatospora kazusensis]|uniref:DUF4190 domain-containing protein n=1 Tax=Kitasatospora kazusensis TaxID=407974 RepID=A0ABP5KHN5_9ACTN
MSSGDNTGERNPFAPPPADAPDQPWQPRTPPQPPAGGPEDPSGGEHPQVPPPHPWSPGQQSGWSPGPPAPQPKFDPNDPVQRRARYALSAGMAALFCVVTGVAYVALLFGALAVHWGISALRAPRKTGGKAEGATPVPPVPPVRPQTPAAIGGLVTGGVAVLFVLGFLGINIYYSDYVNCVNDAPTAEAQQGCSDLGPKFLVDVYTSAGQ